LQICVDERGGEAADDDGEGDDSDSANGGESQS
jgi:hypothetical protein